MASGGVPGRLARGRVHPRPKEAAVVAMAQPGPGQRQTPAQGRHRLPPPSRRAAAASVQGMRETPSPGPPEEKAVLPGDADHVGLQLQRAASGVAPGAGSRWHRARLPAWPQGVCRWGSQEPRVRVLRAACVPALPHHLRWAPSLQHLPDHLQDCLPPKPRAGPRQASLRLLPRLEEDRRAPWGLWSSNMPATMPEWRELCPARPLPLPRRVAGRYLPDRCG
ncbi:epidermal growth factor-like protein 7 isoform X4 [Rhinolophus ferrumequinum]|uniref:epidermal growth factor-like protein 7 isoform X4 n=1 Tax=Rhinolophus ferrumequinum TaxID=59479 RepID=UPI00140FDBCB|nr:epidermal growth factor-like protein 7 isoform X4 [Rhinolophus ferrumequinum]